MQAGYCIAVQGVDVVLADCSLDTTDPKQQWEWVPVGGRHKAYGQFRLASSLSLHNLCLTQTQSSGLSKKKFQTMVALAPCKPTTTLACGQVWTVAPKLDRVTHPKPRATAFVQPSTLKKPPPKILCWVLTYPKAHELKATSINATWGRHCTTLLFMTTEHYEGLPTVTLNIGGEEDRGRLWFVKTHTISRFAFSSIFSCVFYVDKMLHYITELFKTI